MITPLGWTRTISFYTVANVKRVWRSIAGILLKAALNNIDKKNIFLCVFNVGGNPNVMQLSWLSDVYYFGENYNGINVYMVWTHSQGGSWIRTCDYGFLARDANLHALLLKPAVSLRGFLKISWDIFCQFLTLSYLSNEIVG